MYVCIIQHDGIMYHTVPLKSQNSSRCLNHRNRANGPTLSTQLPTQLPTPLAYCGTVPFIPFSFHSFLTVTFRVHAQTA